MKVGDIVKFAPELSEEFPDWPQTDRGVVTRMSSPHADMFWVLWFRMGTTMLMRDDEVTQVKELR